MYDYQYNIDSRLKKMNQIINEFGRWFKIPEFFLFVAKDYLKNNPKFCIQVYERIKKIVED